MLFSSFKVTALLTVGWLVPTAVLAQTPEPPVATPAVAAAQLAPDSTASQRSPRPLFKVGTGLIRGIQFGGYSGLQLPLSVGIEHELRPGWTVYGNAYSSFSVYRRRYLNEFRRSLVPEMGAELGVRRYYNQEKRRQLGRSNGPFNGNYLALQAASSFRNFYNHLTSSRHLYHNHSALTALWGAQRRIGGHGLLDFYAGVGIGTAGRFSNTSYRFNRVQVAPELGLKLSFVW